MISDLDLGGCGDSYRWAQTEEEINCEIKIYELMQKFGINMDSDKEIKLIKNSLNIKIDMKSIKVFLKEVCIFKKELSSYIDSETAIWYLEECEGNELNNKGVILLILLEKKKKGWWDSCFLGESKLDLSQVRGRKNFRDCDERTKSEILKLINNSNKNSNIRYNNETKGTDIENNFDIYQVLKESWNKENSPFQGIEYDPKLVQELMISSNINQNMGKK
ncbi:nuclear movement domain-containing [Cryptosporidium sp. chipmunk genotype I]|uniref:nuclear movement domain-containing n=1 Tax=Cryptosporidium sp. chipmunk genotype I TaxID=1280935 RepID=UPI00351A1A73|nr:nuclear movement domain-containing [Cryptosporidium sp. chipmunk genotype I]